MGGIIGGGGGGAQSTSTSDNRISAMQIQTSNYGNAIPIVYGTTRVSPNLIYYTDFQAISHTTTTSSGGHGGKGGGGGGGGGSSSSTTYTYKAGMMMGLCEGPISSIRTVWRSKDVFSSPSDIGMSLATGEIGQLTQPYLISNHSNEALAYSGLAYVFGWSVDLNSSAAMYNYTYEVSGKLLYGNGIVDANPKDIVYDILTNAQYGAGFKPSDFGSLAEFSNFCVASGIFISPCYDTQKSGADTVNEMAIVTNSAPVYSDGLLKLIPYQDSQITGNGITYTPNITPIYDLNADDFIVQSSNDDPIKVIRNTTVDAFNQVQVEYMNRSNAYNIDIATSKDQASIEVSGFRPQPVVQLHAICDPKVAQIVANNMLQRVLYNRNLYEFSLGWRYGRLEPMDIVTLSEDILGLDRLPVRIKIVEENEDGGLLITAEGCNFGTASSSLYPHQDNSGFAHNYQVDPGNVSTPSFFEPPVDLTTNGLEVWAAVSGQNSNWGGCSIWASLDGLNYKRQSQVFGGSRYGVLTAPLSDSLSVSLDGIGGQILSGTIQDSATLQTLCLVTDGVNTEYLSYQTANLTGVNNYTLTGLVRGAYQSFKNDKAQGSRFVRVDSSIAKSGDIDHSLIEKNIYFKFTSFNVYLGAEQSLANVTAYQYKVTGEMLNLPPEDVSGLNIGYTNNGVLVTWESDSQPDWAYTELRLGNAWDEATLVTKKQSTSHLLGFLISGVTTVLAKHIDNYGIYSAHQSAGTITVLPPKSVLITRSEVQENSVALGWGDSKENQPITSYSMYIGNEGQPIDQCTLYGKAGSDSRSDIVIFRSSGKKVIWMTATDIAGNTSIPVSIAVNVSLPSNFVLANEYDESWLSIYSGGEYSVSGYANNDYVSSATSAVRGYINGFTDGGSLYLPVKNETWEDHFSGIGYATIQDQINSGFISYFQNSESAGSYYELHDIGKIISSANISVTAIATVISGSVDTDIFIEWSSDNISWNTAGHNISEAHASSVRYIKVTYSVSATGGDDLVRIDRIHVLVSSSTANEFGALILNPGDIKGTPYYCSKEFLDIVSAVATANNSENIYRINTIISDTESPQIVYVQAWDSSNNRTGGTVSLNIGGY